MKETRHKGSHVFDYIYMKHPGKSDWCLPRGCGGERRRKWGVTVCWIWDFLLA